MTELSFLIDLLLNHRLPKATRDAVAVRIREVEGKAPTPSWIMPANSNNSYQVTTLPNQPAGLAPQSPSTLAALARHPDLVAEMTRQAEAPSANVAVIAQTPAAAAAMAQRQATILQAQTGKPMAGETRPRKF